MAALLFGLTFEEYCSHRLSLSRFHVFQVLNGKRHSPKLVERIACDLGVDTSDIMSEPNPTRPLLSA